MIPQMEPCCDEAEARAVYDYVKSGGWLTEFRQTRAFETAIADFVDARHCSIVSSGTAALFVAMQACEIGPGDDVVVPDLTMVATANAVALAGANVVFADIERQSLCLTTETLEAVITPQTKAVVVVSLNGRYPSDMMALLAFCRARGIRVIEDAAQSLGSRIADQHLGTLGDIGVYSFSAPKVITTGQGGAIVTNDSELHQRVLRIRDFGRRQGGVDHYESMGWNFKFTDLQATVGLAQMAKLPARLERKKAMFARYLDGLKNCPAVAVPPTNLMDTAPWFIDLLCARRDELAVYLKESGIGTRPFYPPLHAEPVYNRTQSFPVAESISASGLWLPSSVLVTDEDIDNITAMIRRFYMGA